MLVTKHCRSIPIMSYNKVLHLLVRLLIVSFLSRLSVDVSTVVLEMPRVGFASLDGPVRERLSTQVSAPRRPTRSAPLTPDSVQERGQLPELSQGWAVSRQHAVRSTSPSHSAGPRGAGLDRGAERAKSPPYIAPRQCARPDRAMRPISKRPGAQRSVGGLGSSGFIHPAWPLHRTVSEPLLVPRLSFSCTSVVADSGYKRAFAPMCKRNAS